MIYVLMFVSLFGNFYLAQHLWKYRNLVKEMQR